MSNFRAEQLANHINDNFINLLAYPLRDDLIVLSEEVRAKFEIEITEDTDWHKILSLCEVFNDL